METEVEVREDSTLAAVRRRGLLYLNYIFWAIACFSLLFAADSALSIGRAWLAFLETIRRALGLAPPAAGPDYWVLAGIASGILIPAALAALAYGWYKRAWTRRLRGVWDDTAYSRHARVPRLEIEATTSGVASQTRYLRALGASPQWKDAGVTVAEESRDSYTKAAAQLLRMLEEDIARRAVTTGLVVGFTRNHVIDSFSIVAAGFELQFFVLTRLGKKPSLRTWVEMVKRTTSSLFMNWYISGEDALYMKLAIQRMAMGIEMASDAAEHALHDINWDDLVGSLHVPGLSHVGSLATTTVGIGAHGMRHIGEFIAKTSDDLLRGALAAGILYYHGMALAADCLALDEQHRESAEMTRTISQAMGMACAPAGRLLRDQVRQMRKFLRKRRQMAITAAKGLAKQGAGSVVENVRSASSKAWSSLRPIRKPRNPGV